MINPTGLASTRPVPDLPGRGDLGGWDCLGDFGLSHDDACPRASLNLCSRRIHRGPLSEIMERNDSDKGGGPHNYTLYYEPLFQDDRDQVERVFEMGIGSTNPELPFNTGADGVPGASLRGWREYFSRAAIFGGDIDEHCLFEEDRIRTGIVDQTKPVPKMATTRM